MSFWTNKHVVIAMLMAPVLALVAYFGVNMLVGEKPQAAKPGQSYELIEKPNCRYSSGSCDLKNGEFELTLGFEWLADDNMLLKLVSTVPLDGVLLAMVENGTDDEQPVEMLPAGGDGLNWFLELDHPDPAKHRLHLAASAAGALYFGDAAMRFTIPEDKEAGQ